MANWWELSEQEIDQDAEALKERAAAYYNALYREDESRYVLLDIASLCYTRQTSAEATLATIELLHTIKARAGLTQSGEKAAIDAEASSMI
jgi:hypothetical protein